MTRKTGYQGEAPEELFAVSNGDEFRTYVYLKQALRWMDSQTKMGKSSYVITYVRRDDG